MLHTHLILDGIWAANHLHAGNNFLQLEMSFISKWHLGAVSPFSPDSPKHVKDDLLLPIKIGKIYSCLQY